MSETTTPAPATGTIEVDAVVIGSGFAGLYSIHKLRDDLGLNVQAFDNAAGVGGTWYWNQYPGARSDTEVNAYCYSFDKDLFLEWKWSERYPRQSEILAYLNHVADRYDLRRSIEFSTQVEKIIWDEETARYTLTTSAGKVYSAQFVVEAVGLLSATNFPRFPGQDNFAGEIHHTARWPHDGVDLAGKRVAVIGTGSSGIQVIAEIAPVVGELTVFQRHAQWVVPAKHRPIAPGLLESIENNYDQYWHDVLYSITCFGFDESETAAESVSPEERRATFERVYEDGGGFQYMFRAFNDVTTSLVANKAATDLIAEKIRATVKDPALAQLLTPTELFAKRPLCCDNYYETYNRDNVTLVDALNHPILEFTEKGIRTDEGEYEVDVIVLATGFDAVSGNQLRIEHIGREGVTLQELWKDRPRTHLGLAAVGFPNLFMIYGPMGPFTNQPPAHEAQVDWVAGAIQHVRDRGLRSIEPTREAEARWMQICDEGAAATLFPRVNSWINGANVPGKPVTNMFYMSGMAAYMAEIEHEADTGYPGFEMSDVPSPVG
jgi:cation diffusion facilitator CzcD-associated flavoprotein CzcO